MRLALCIALVAGSVALPAPARAEPLPPLWPAGGAVYCRTEPTQRYDARTGLWWLECHDAELGEAAGDVPTLAQCRREFTLLELLDGACQPY